MNAPLQSNAAATAWVLATGNPHKVREVSEILSPHGITLLSLQDVGGSLAEPEEDGATFADNARLKARYYALHTGRPCVAEDSGLEVDALGGAPGVFSARYAGVDGTRAERDAQNNAKLLRELAEVPWERRTARFVCAVCVANPDGTVVAETYGTYAGHIGFEPKGENGFGYDPLLYLQDVSKTSAELTPKEKHERSHRGAAFRALVQRLGQRLAGPST